MRADEKSLVAIRPARRMPGYSTIGSKDCRMISCAVQMKFKSRFFDFFSEPSTRGKVRLAQRGTMDASLSRRTDQS
jgi:hypothetical protein